MIQASLLRVFMMKMMRYWHRLPGVVMEWPPMELNMSPTNLIGLWGWSCLKQEVGQWRPPEVPSNPSCSVILCLLPLITTKAACHCKIKWSTCRWSWQLWWEWENKFKSWCFFLQFLSCMLMLGQKAFFLKKHSLCIFSCWFVSISVASSVLEWCWRRTFTSDH